MIFAQIDQNCLPLYELSLISRRPVYSEILEITIDPLQSELTSFLQYGLPDCDSNFGLQERALDHSGAKAL